MVRSIKVKVRIGHPLLNGVARVEQTIGKASLQDAAIRTGIVVEQMFLLTGQPPVLQMANIVLPTVEKERDCCGRHAKRRDSTGLLDWREPRAAKSFGQSNCVILRTCLRPENNAIETHEHAGEFKEW